MSVIVYYAHVSGEQLRLLRATPDRLWQIQDDAEFKDAELYDMDKDWQVIPWLLSEKRREEQKWAFAQTAAMMRKDFDWKVPGARWQAVEDERRKLGVTTDAETTKKMPDDAVLEAMEGRGSRGQRDAAIDLGLGAARVFSPDDVRALSEQISLLGPDDLRRHFDGTEMARWDVGGFDWLEEDDSVLELLTRAFQMLQAFYKRAAEAGHHVLVIYH